MEEEKAHSPGILRLNETTRVAHLHTGLEPVILGDIKWEVASNLLHMDKKERTEYYIVIDRVSRTIKGYPVFSYGEAEQIRKTVGGSFIVEKKYRCG